ncbi:XkdQ/YqbQ family protein [Peptostreptococcus equinus]|uniref:NlpC/P60 family protein n=1 Tax=Peptostreptococcus equinus TaxID=3003601 RepID=A0ABY7JQH2_9FIRM|nr:NlpC/P60 family protein [Peptostreptococcus sp. CBA3647]WAW14744.1 NlpC/P60 family protein [Peptostreptococcus sp. CBA3647]
MNNIKLIVHIRNGPFWDITSMIPYVKISGSKSSVSRTLETELYQSINDKQIQQLGIIEGSSVCFYVDNDEKYRGNIIDVGKSSNSITTKIICKDVGHTLAKSKHSRNFVSKTAEQVSIELIKLSKLNLGKVENTNIKLTRYFRDTSIYEIIMTMYTLASKTTKKQYMIDVNLDTVNIVERGKALSIAFDEDSNIISAEHNRSIEELVNQVTVVDKNGNKISEHINKDLIKIWGRMHNAILEVENKSQVNTAMINEQYHGVDFTSKLEGYGNYDCKSGMKVHISDKHTGLIGEFYIDSDTHEWSGGNYKCSLDLNFNNIMDTKEAGSDRLEENSNAGETTTVGTSDWGHDVTVEMLNKILRGKLAGKGDIFYKYGNMYRVNPMVLALIARIECGAKMDSNLAMNSNNFFGIRDPRSNIRKTSKGFGIYSTIDEGVRAGFHFIGISHVYNKKRNLSQLITVWAPPFENNTSGYIANVKNLYKQYTGTDWSDTKMGTGVASDADADKNISYVASDSGSIVGSNGVKYVNQKQKIIVEEALKMVGKGRYTYGGSRSNIYATDCSGFIHILHKKAGIRIGGDTSSQKNNGRAVSLSQALPGDYIVMGSRYSPSGRHVVLCVGNGMIVHNGGPQGKPITKQKLYTYGSYYVRRCWD